VGKEGNLAPGKIWCKKLQEKYQAFAHKLNENAQLYHTGKIPSSFGLWKSSPFL